MRNILVPTDFSSCSYKAAQFGVEIAKKTDARIVFYHAYFLPVLTHEAYLGPDILIQYENNAAQELTRFAAEVLASVSGSSQLEFHNIVEPGLPSQHIEELVKEHMIDLVVIGTKGQHGTIRKIVLGSNAATLAEICAVPVLVVPQQSIFKPIKKIIFATTLENIYDVKVLEPLLEWTWLDTVEIHFLVVIKKGSRHHSEEQLKEYLLLENIFKNIPHFLEVVEDNDITGSIEKYSNDIKADMLVTIPKNHHFFEKLFDQSVTRELIFHSEIPILCLK